MENASKALIIAGAILLAIAIIGIGMYVFQIATSTIGQANMTGQEIDAYNAEFVKYQGLQTGSTVKALCDSVRTHNAQYTGAGAADVSKQIVLTSKAAKDPAAEATVGTTSADITKLKQEINAGRRYMVSFGYTKTGMIKNIGVVLQK